MTANQLIEALNAFVAADPYRGDMQVTYGREPVEGGVVARDARTGTPPFLVLFPHKLADMGGF